MCLCVCVRACVCGVLISLSWREILPKIFSNTKLICGDVVVQECSFKWVLWSH